MRVLITSELIYPHIGGVENSIRHLASEAVAHDDEVVIVASDIPADSGALSESRLNHVPVLVYRSFHRWPQPLRRVMSFFSAVRLYRSIGATFSPDVVLARYHFNVLAAWVAGLRRIHYLVPGIVRIQNSTTNRQISHSVSGMIALWVNSLLQRYALAASDRIFVFSQSMETQTRTVWSKAAVSIVAPGVDPSRFPMTGHTHNKERSVELLFVVRLVTAKGVRYAIEALQHLPARFVLTIVGDGEERSVLEQLASRLGVAVRVRFVGETAAPEEFYRQAQIFVMPSIYEPFGQSIIEAAACGLPIVAFAPAANIQTATFEIMGNMASYAGAVTSSSFAVAVESAYRACYIEQTLDRAAVSKHIAARYSWARLYEALTLRSP